MNFDRSITNVMTFDMSIIDSRLDLERGKTKYLVSKTGVK